MEPGILKNISPNIEKHMEIVPIPQHLEEACLCMVFGSTLIGFALKWLLNVLH